MRALEPLDELFLAQDSGPTTGHVGTLLPFDAAGASVELSADDLQELIEERLELLPVLRRRPEPDPARRGLHRWTEDESVDLAAHVHGHRLDGGDDRALGRFAAQLNASPLDRSRPPWEMHVIGGLQDGRVGVLSKFHHVLGDAIPLRLVLDTLFAVGYETPPAARGRSAIPRSQASDATPVPAGPQVTARPMRFNQPLSDQRDFAFTSFERERIDRIRSAARTAFTAVLLAAWAGALRGWLAMRGETPAVPLVARLPISLRRADDDSAWGNHLAVLTVPAPADQADARARVRSAHEAMVSVKQALRSGAWAGAAAGGVNFALSAWLGSNSRLAWRGAAGLGIYSLPMLNVSGLAIACSTNRDETWIGVHVDSEQVTDPWSLLRAFDLAVADLETAAAA